MFSYQYAYLIGIWVTLFPIWLFLFIHRKDLRREIFIINVLSGVSALFLEPLYLRDYWRPETFTGWSIGIEDLLFGFFIGGIASSIYEEIFGKRFTKRRDREHHWSWFIIPIVAFLIFILNLLVFVFGVNSMYASITVFIFFALFMLRFRKDLITDVFISGLLMGAIAFFAYIVFLSLFPEAINRWWMLKNISGIMIFGIPIEEFMWAFGWGMAVGPMYEFFAGLKFKNLPSTKLNLN